LILVLGKAIFREALDEGHCESFFTLIQHFITQNDISTCSTASMAMMLNALKVDPGENWKGIWRWYDDYNIQHMHPSKIKEGLTLKEFNDLAGLNSVRSMAFSPLKGSPQAHQAGLKKSDLNLFKKCV
jgi:glutathione gamma-glutamylcysteinyltransferase